jgi:hypothetical protein
MPPPRPNYGWVNPYYENRDGVVIFIDGHWSPPGVAFVAPAPGLHLTVEIAGPGVIPGPPPMGPSGVFIPAPPGSRFGIIIPAPIGISPAVVTSAPPVVAVGMRVNINNTTNNVSNTTNTTNVTNITKITNVTNVTVVAPASATATGRAVNASVPAQAHLAAALPPVVKVQAPRPVSSKPIPSYVHGRAPPALPAAQAVKVESAPRAAEPAASPPGRPATAVKPAERPAAKPAEKPAPKPAEKPAPKPAEKPAPKPAEKPAAKPEPANHPPITKETAKPKPAATPTKANAPAKATPERPKKPGDKDDAKKPDHDKDTQNN